MEYYVEYIPLEEQNMFYEKNIKKYEELEILLKNTKMDLENNITSLYSKS